MGGWISQELLLVPLQRIPAILDLDWRDSRREHAKLCNGLEVHQLVNVCFLLNKLVHCALISLCLIKNCILLTLYHFTFTQWLHHLLHCSCWLWKPR